jgi:hypothetical protein
MYKEGIEEEYIEDEIHLRAEDSLYLEPVDDGCLRAEEEAQFAESEDYSDNVLEHFGMQDQLDEAPMTNMFASQYGTSWVPSYLPHYQVNQEYLGLVGDPTQEDTLMNGFWQPRRHY